MNLLRTIIFYIICFIYLVLLSPIICISLINKNLTNFCMNNGTKGMLWLLKHIAKISYQIHFPETNLEIPEKKNENIRLDKKVIIASKHSSVLEVAVLKIYVPNAFFIIKKELLFIPIYGWAFARMGFVAVNRNRGKTNMSNLANKVAKKIINGRTLIIFPEGTRANVHNQAKIKRGLLFLAEHLKLPILPVSTDAGLYWPKRGSLKKGTANIYFEDILPSSASSFDIEKAISRYANK